MVPTDCPLAAIQTEALLQSSSSQHEPILQLILCSAVIPFYFLRYWWRSMLCLHWQGVGLSACISGDKAATFDFLRRASCRASQRSQSLEATLVSQGSSSTSLLATLLQVWVPQSKSIGISSNPYFFKHILAERCLLQRL